MTDLSMSERYDFTTKVMESDDAIRNATVCPSWIDDHHFWYERREGSDTAYVLVDARAGSVVTSASLAVIARKLGEALDCEIDPDNLLLRTARFSADEHHFLFTAYGSAYRFDPEKGELAEAKMEIANPWLISPDGVRAAFLKDGDLWLRDMATGKERELTDDGEEYYAYADVPAARRPTRVLLNDTSPEALWSPDCKWILTVQTDDRHVPDLALANYAPYGGVRPEISRNRTSLPRDERATEFRMVAIEAATGRQVEADYRRLSAVRMNDTPFSGGLAWWSADGLTAYFVDVERGEKSAHVVAFDIATGECRVLFSELTDSYVELSVNVYMPALLRPLPETHELIWYSERSGNGHLYLYDLETGKCLRAVTKGDWRVREILHVDPVKREVLLLAGGIAEDENPYKCKPALASLDGDGSVTVVSGLPGEHRIWTSSDMMTMTKKILGWDTARISGVSPSGRYFIETVSDVSILPVTYLRDRNGEEIACLEQASGELPGGWQWPEPVECIAADGETKVYGLLFKPLSFEEGKSYPLIDLVYGGPQLSIVPQGNFTDLTLQSTSFIEAMSLSAIGSYVLLMDGRGTACRERSFRLASYGALQDGSKLEDHVSAIRQLTKSRPGIDLDRIGVTGFSGGGYLAAHAALRFGDFFKVAVAGGGNYDMELFWHTWGERYHGAYEADLYSAQAAKTYAANLKGKLMLVHGLQDSGCHPAGLFQLVQALIDADKDHDLVILPRAGHEWTPYGQRRRFDYFVRHLLKAEPPVDPKPFLVNMDRIRKKVMANMQVPGAPA